MQVSISQLDTHLQPVWVVQDVRNIAGSHDLDPYQISQHLCMLRNGK
jgi:hypothetical protein